MGSFWPRIVAGIQAEKECRRRAGGFCLFLFSGTRDWPGCQDTGGGSPAENLAPGENAIDPFVLRVHGRASWKQ